MSVGEPLHRRRKNPECSPCYMCAAVMESFIYRTALSGLQWRCDYFKITDDSLRAQTGPFGVGECGDAYQKSKTKWNRILVSKVSICVSDKYFQFILPWQSLGRPQQRFNAALSVVGTCLGKQFGCRRVFQLGTNRISPWRPSCGGSIGSFLLTFTNRTSSLKDWSSVVIIMT